MSHPLTIDESELLNILIPLFPEYYPFNLELLHKEIATPETMDRFTVMRAYERVNFTLIDDGFVEAHASDNKLLRLTNDGRSLKAFGRYSRLLRAERYFRPYTDDELIVEVNNILHKIPDYGEFYLIKSCGVNQYMYEIKRVL